MLCQFCKKNCKNHNSLRNHERLCKENPNRQIIISNFIEWNKKVKSGLEKVSNQYIKAKEKGDAIIVSDQTRAKIRNAVKGRKLTNEQRERLKISMRRAVLNNPKSYSSNNVSGRTPIIEYKGFKLKGKWELEVAHWLDNNDIKWTNITDGFDYEWRGSKHRYYPDFHLLDYNIYIEVKGFERDRDIAKWQAVENLVLIRKNEIRMIKEGIYQLIY
jgi:hypothetical protein